MSQAYTNITIENQDSIHNLKTAFHNVLTSKCSAYIVAESAAVSSNKELKSGFSHLESLQLAKLVRENEVKALHALCGDTRARVEAFERSIEQQRTETVELDKEYKAAQTASTTVPLSEFEGYYEQYVTPKAQQLEDAKKSLLLLEAEKSQHIAELDVSMSTIQSKQLEIKEQEEKINEQFKKIGELKAQFNVKLSQLRACAAPMNLAETLLSKDEEITRLKAELAVAYQEATSGTV